MHANRRQLGLLKGRGTFFGQWIYKRKSSHIWKPRQFSILIQVDKTYAMYLSHRTFHAALFLAPAEDFLSSVYYMSKLEAHYEVATVAVGWNTYAFKSIIKSKLYTNQRGGLNQPQWGLKQPLWKLIVSTLQAKAMKRSLFKCRDINR